VKLEDLAQGRTAVLGFGRESQALESVVLERLPGAKVQVFSEQAGPQVPEHWSITIAPLADAPLHRFDRILRSPGVPVDHPALVAARSDGAEITTSSSLWFSERAQARTIVVTGSKGKSTTSALLAHMLNVAGIKTCLAGNIGIPLISLLDEPADCFVIELSSYQLVDLIAAPSVGVITRLFPEHVDWHGSVDRYYAAKLQLLELLQGRPLWINARDTVLKSAVDGYAALCQANLEDGLHSQPDGLYDGPSKRLNSRDCALRGQHNLDNLALAISVAETINPGISEYVDAARSFQPLAHRLESIRDNEAREWINDSISTTPYATQAALDCCGSDVVLIAGGLDRPADWSELVAQQDGRRFTGVVGLPDNGQQVIDALVRGGLVDPDKVRVVADMSGAVRAAVDLANAESQILLSPGAPSFPHFRDFEDRGNQFRQAIADRAQPQTEQGA